MENIIVEMLPANEGDCILITIEEEDIHILIDGGTARTYHNVLKEKLVKIKEAGKCLDLVIVTHIDDDHIGGIIELLKENGTAEESNIVEIKEIWHNSYRHLQFEKNSVLGKKEEKILKQYLRRLPTINDPTIENSTKEISAIQGTTLATLILKGGYLWNSLFAGGAIYTTHENMVCLGRECKITVLTPSDIQLANLGGKWKKELNRARVGFEFSDDKLFDDAYEYYMRYYGETSEGESKDIAYNSQEEENIEVLAAKDGKPDSSLTNRASISICLQYLGKQLLFLSDAYVADALSNWEGSKEFALIKLPHHGSVRNVTKEEIDAMETDTYLISTNSAKHNHPDKEVLAKILCKRTDYVKKVYFNYEVETVKTLLDKLEKYDDTEFVFLEPGQTITISCDKR